MAGSKEGGKLAAETNKARYGKDFYTKIGAMGGKKGRTGGFYANRELARKVGAIGGSKSKRGPWTEAQRAAYYATKKAQHDEKLSWVDKVLKNRSTQ